MVAPNREIANKYHFNSSAISSLNNNNNILEDINRDSSRGRSNIVNRNSSREHSTASSIFSVAYSKWMEIQNDDPNWTNQTAVKLFNILFSSQVEGENNNQVLANNNPQSPTIYANFANNIFPIPNQSNLISPSLSYAQLQPVDVNSWKGWT